MDFRAALLSYSSPRFGRNEIGPVFAEPFKRANLAENSAYLWHYGGLIDVASRFVRAALVHSACSGAFPLA